MRAAVGVVDADDWAEQSDSALELQLPVWDLWSKFDCCDWAWIFVLTSSGHLKHDNRWFDILLTLEILYFFLQYLHSTPFELSFVKQFHTASFFGLPITIEWLKCAKIEKHYFEVRMHSYTNTCLRHYEIINFIRNDVLNCIPNSKYFYVPCTYVQCMTSQSLTFWFLTNFNILSGLHTTHADSCQLVFEMARSSTQPTRQLIVIEVNAFNDICVSSVSENKISATNKERPKLFYNLKNQNTLFLGI